MSRHRDEIYIGNMRDACARVGRFLTDVSWAAFVENEEKQFAVIRQLEIIGEAGSKVSPACQAEHPDIQWRTVKDVRNELINEYQNLTPERVWALATTRIPDLLPRLEALLSAPTPDPPMPDQDPEGPRVAPPSKPPAKL